MTRNTLVIVFGAGGRLGTRLLLLLAKEPVTVLAVARKDKPNVRPPGMHWMQIDVTNPAEWPRSLGALTGIAGVHRHTVLVDLLLKRATVTTMRTSIAAVTSYILQLHERLAAVGQSSSLVSASTTATLAPWLYQTPYGLAKRQQLARYATSGISGTAFLLPSLAETGNDRPENLGLSWSYSEAARKLAAAITGPTTSVHGRNPFRLVVPDPPTRQSAVDSYTQRAKSAARRLLPAHMSLLFGRWDSPQQHREASHHRLAVTPPSLREYVDHHRVPPFLLRRLKRSLGGLIEVTNPAPSTARAANERLS
ncbi:MAG: hypothetical protein GEU98_12730 [Pseudonocardiaceae bacterium]|nr:hypothetical protein [Pseudonocardiaceae bacterium]